MNINLHIERLILKDVPLETVHRPLLQAAVESELGRLLADNGFSTDFLNEGALRTIKSNSVEIGDETMPIDLGGQIAQAVYGGLNR